MAGRHVASEMTVCVLDIGKSNVKLVLLDAAGRTLASRGRANVVRAGPPYPHFDAAGIERWIVATLAELPGRDAIEAIVPVAHGCGAALVAGDMLALPMLDYEYAGPDETAAAYDAAADGFALDATPPLPLGLLLGRQFFWQSRRFPAAFARTTDILPNAQFWAWRLSGEKASEITTIGCHGGLWRPAGRRWSALAEREGWAARFPPMRNAWDSLGPPRPDVLAATGIDPQCRVLCGAHDSNVSFLAHRATRAPPFTVISTGTWTIVMAAGADLSRLDAARDMLANVDVFGDPVPTARFMGGREFAAVAGDGGGATFADAARVMARGTLVRPAFVTESGPFAGSPGSILGPPPATPGERAALAGLYVALVVDVMLDLLGAQPPYVVEGPSAADPVFLAALASLRPQAEVVASDDGTGTGAGALVLARWTGGAAPPPAGRAVAGGALDVAGYRALWREVLPVR
jgi:sugar (pentulose or hexulose) kinase